MKAKAKKLSLKKETVRDLRTDEMTQANGAGNIIYAAAIGQLAPPPPPPGTTIGQSFGGCAGGYFGFQYKI